MTLPYERARAVLAADEFLRRLASPYVANGLKKIPKDVRDEARRLLRHYPHPYELHAAAKAAPDVFDVQAGYDLPESAQCPP
jgi:hypothetical protein